MRSSLACALLASAALAGCFDPGPGFIATGDDARFLPRQSYAYDGAGVERVQGSIRIEADEAANTARVEAAVTRGGREYRVEWSRVAGGEPYQSGGVARNLRVHGAAGNGSSELPEFFAYLGLWGRARVLVDGEPAQDPTTLDEEFPARLYVARGHVRDAETHMIYGATRSRVYDPAQPGEASVDPEGAQILVELRTATGALWYHFEFERVRLERV